MKAKVFFAVAAAQALFLLAWAGWHEYVRQTGQVILLETQPVDPHDLVRGDYLILSYKISSVAVTPAANAGGAQSSAPAPVAGAEVWVVLEQRGKYYEAASATLARPDVVGLGQILVQGKLDERSRVRYGIEEYFVPEGRGSTPWGKMLEVEAAVSPDHQLNLKRVLVDGKAYP